MTRKLKALSTALIAVFAVSAAFASMASADDLTSEVSPVTLTGTGDTSGPGVNVLTFPGAGITSCTTSTYKGTNTTPTTSITVTPAYSGCTSVGFPAVIHTNGCDYVLTILGGGSTKANAEVVCPVGQEITVTAISAGTTKCTIHIPPQKGLTTITGTNIGSGATGELLLHLEIHNITAKTTTGTGIGACPATHTSLASLAGTVTVTGEEDKATNPAHVGIFLS